MKLPVEIVPVYVEFIPDTLKQDIFYIAKEYNATNHLCLCGCGHQCYLPINEEGWTLIEKNGKISLEPSILQRFACKSHYVITDNIANFV